MHKFKKAVGHVFTAGVCLDFDIGEGCTDSLHVQLSPHLLHDPFSPVHHVAAMYQFSIIYKTQKQVKLSDS